MTSFWRIILSPTGNRETYHLWCENMHGGWSEVNIDGNIDITYAHKKMNRIVLSIYESICLLYHQLKLK